MFGYDGLFRARTNAVHLTLATLQKQRHIGTIVTQNVDGLHHQAFHDVVAYERDLSQVVDHHSVASQKRSSDGEIVELHGNLHEVACMRCHRVFSRRKYQEQLRAANTFAERQYKPDQDKVRADGDFEAPETLIKSFKLVPCQECDGAIRPNVVMFGASVEKEKVDAVFSRVEKAQRVLCLGTSLQVYSAFRFVIKATELQKPVMVVNNGTTRAKQLTDKNPELDIRHVHVEDLSRVMPLVPLFMHRQPLV